MHKSANKNVQGIFLTRYQPTLFTIYNVLEFVHWSS